MMQPRKKGRLLFFAEGDERPRDSLKRVMAMLEEVDKHCIICGVDTDTTEENVSLYNVPYYEPFLEHDACTKSLRSIECPSCKRAAYWRGAKPRAGA